MTTRGGQEVDPCPTARSTIPMKNAAKPIASTERKYREANREAIRARQRERARKRRAAIKAAQKDDLRRGREDPRACRYRCGKTGAFGEGAGRKGIPVPASAKRTRLGRCSSLVGHKQGQKMAGMEKPPLHFSRGARGGEERRQLSIRYGGELARNCSSPGRRITRGYLRSNSGACVALMWVCWLLVDPAPR